MKNRRVFWRETRLPPVLEPTERPDSNEINEWRNPDRIFLNRPLEVGFAPDSRRLRRALDLPCSDRGQAQASFIFLVIDAAVDTMHGNLRNRSAFIGSIGVPLGEEKRIVRIGEIGNICPVSGKGTLHLAISGSPGRISSYPAPLG